MTRDVYGVQNADKLLKAGRVEEWNAFRIINSDWHPDLKGADFTEAQLPAVDLTRVDLSGAVFRGAKLDDAYFSESTLRRATFDNASLMRVAFDRADLEDATFDDAVLTDSSFREARLQGSGLQSSVTRDPFLPTDQGNVSLLTLLKGKLDLLWRLSPERFVQLVGEILLHFGYVVEDTSSRGSDRGYDLRAVRKDPIEGERLYLVECKSYSRNKPVGLAPIRAVYAAKLRENADEAIVVTNTYFTKDAISEAAGMTDLVLIDHERLLEWITRGG